MKTNYQIIMEDIINNLDKKPKLLLHACCGICSSSVLERLIPYFDITVLYYNPNIYPEEEYKKRYETLKELITKSKSNVKIKEIGYESEKFDKIAQGLENEKEGGARCNKCFGWGSGTVSAEGAGFSGIFGSDTVPVCFFDFFWAGGGASFTNFNETPSLFFHSSRPFAFLPKT